MTFTILPQIGYDLLYGISGFLTGVGLATFTWKSWKNGE